MKKIVSLCLVALFLCFLPGCSSKPQEQEPGIRQVTDYENHNETPRKGGTLRLALAGMAELNPLLAENDNNLSVFKLVYDSLFQRTPSEVTEPVLCENFTVSADGLLYEFTVKSGVGFHNGDALTASDVEATLNMIFATENHYRERLSVISSFYSQGQVLSVTLQYPVANFTALLDFPILSENDISNYNGLSYVPNGTGRFKVQSYKKSKELYLSVNENYFREFSPYIENISVMLLKDNASAVTMLENLQIDVLTSDVVNLNEYTPKRNLSSVEYTGGHFTFIGINNQKPAFLSAGTRTALSGAVSRKDLVTSASVTYAAVADVPVPSGSFWNGSGVPDALEGAQVKTRLIEDGWHNVDTSNLPEKEVYGEVVTLQPEILVNSDNPTRVKVAEQVKTMWNVAGIQAYVTALPFEDYRARVEAMDYDVFVGGVSVLENYDLSFLLRTNANFCGVSNERIDLLLTDISLCGKDIESQRLFYELCDVLKSEMPLVGLYFENDILIFDSRVRGAITPSGSDAFYGFDFWFLAE